MKAKLINKDSSRAYKMLEMVRLLPSLNVANSIKSLVKPHSCYRHTQQAERRAVRTGTELQGPTSASYSTTAT